MSLLAVLFDLDGTLADTITDIGNAVNATLVDYGFEPHLIESYKMMVGNGFRMLMERALPEGFARDSELFPALVREAAERYRSMALETTVPFDGISELLAILSARGIKLGVLSNKPDPMTKQLVPALFPEIPFFAIEGDMPDKARKPDPGRALQILKSAGIPPERCAFVGDSGVDMETGVNGKMLPLGVAWGYRTIAELQEHGAKAILQRPSDLLPLMGLA
ncbi:MAG: HAD family hydrolase [Spirochaetaceae bacterium]|nr:HAD family hydrolase [Spirochaetaceae bacterium]